MGFVTKDTNDTCYRAHITLTVNNIAIVDAITDNCTVSGFIDDVQEYNLITWKVEVPKTYTNLPSYLASNGTVRVTSAVLYQAALDQGYTIVIDDTTVSGLTGGEIAAIVIGSLLGLLIIVTGIITYFCTHKCFWMRNQPIKNITMEGAYLPNQFNHNNQFYIPQEHQQ